MMKYLFLFILCFSSAYPSEFKENSFVDGSLEKVTTSDIPGCKWIKGAKSLKLSPSSFKLQPRPWEPLPSEMVMADLRSFVSPEFGDVDNDKDIDLLIIGKNKGKIVLFRNLGTPYNPLFKKEKGISTDKPAYDATLGDIDQNGILDLLTFYRENNIGYVQGYKGMGNGEFQRYTNWDLEIPYTSPKGYRADITGSIGDLDNDGDPDLIVLVIDKGTNTDYCTYDRKFFAYENKNNSFIEKPEWKPFDQMEESIGATYNASLELVDIDKNNTLDCIFMGDEYGFIDMYKNIGTDSPLWDGEAEQNYPFFDHYALEGPEGNFIAGSIGFADLDSDGDLDAMRGSSAGILVAYENLYLKDRVNFKFPCFIQKQRPCFVGNHVDSVMAFVDLDKDGDYDEIYAEGEGSCEPEALIFPPNKGTPENTSFSDWRDILWIDKYEDYDWFVIPTVADLNGDSKPDLLVAEYEDDKGRCGVGGFKNISTQTYNFEYYPQWNLSGEFLGSLVSNNDLEIRFLRPFLLDLDNDKDYDLILFTRKHLFLFENIGGTSTFVGTRNETWEKNTNWGIPFDSQYLYTYCLTAIDLDGDNLEDIVISGRGASDDISFFYVYKRLGTLTSPCFERKPEYEEEIKKTSNYRAFCGVDIDNDGDYDLVTSSNACGPLLSAMNVSPHHPLGTYTSPLFDAGSSVIFESIFWKERKPFETDIAMFVRYGNSPDTLS
ncbi:MAG: VCBS repeat-containing protein, partial [bacterium]